MGVEVGELTLERARAALNGERPHITYCDPPWGPGLLTMFRTMTGENDYQADWPGFLELLATVIADSQSAHIFLEMGPRFVDEMASVMTAHGLPECNRWEVLYGSPKRTSSIWYSGPGAPCNPSGMSGVKMTRHVLESVSRPSALVFDPCCGKGMTARCAVRAGMRFAGVELVPVRAQVTIDWLAKNDPSRAA
jgi:hypothetical protein